MDIHKPRPWHNWRDFLKELGTIALGVSIAIAAEQAVEWWHWQGEVQTARKTLMAEIAAKRPNIDVEINFDLNSADLAPGSEPQLNNLGKALSSPEMQGTVVMLGGHTDAKGTDDYNQKLSERRAETVKRFLVDNYKVAPDLLVTSGYGKEGLKNATDPFAAENRRVEIINMSEKEQSAK